MSNKILNTKGSQHVRIEDFSLKKLTDLGGIPVAVLSGGGGGTTYDTNLGVYGATTLRIVISSNDPIHTTLDDILAALNGSSTNIVDLSEFEKIDSNSYSFVNNNTGNILTKIDNSNTTVSGKGITLTAQTFPAYYREYNNYIVPVNSINMLVTWTIKLPENNIDNYIRWGIADLFHDFEAPDLATYFQYNNGVFTTHYMAEGSKSLASFEYDNLLDGTGSSGIDLVNNKIYTFFIRYQSDKSIFHLGIMDEKMQLRLIDKRGGTEEPILNPATLALRLRPFFEVRTNLASWGPDSIQLLNTSIYQKKSLNILSGLLNTYTLNSQITITDTTEENLLAIYYSPLRDGTSGIRKILLQEFTIIINNSSDYEINIYYNNDIENDITSAEVGIDSDNPGNDFIDIGSLRFREIPQLVAPPNSNTKIYSEMYDSNVKIIDLKNIFFKYFGIDFTNVTSTRSGIIISFKSYDTGIRLITNSKICWREI